MEAIRSGSRRQTLLIVEDAILTAIALRDGLEDAGYKVLELASRVEEATALARACRPDMALVNIELQGHDDGIGLARQFKAMGIPVLFISGQSIRARSPDTGAMGSLPKPYSPADMVSAVDYLFGLLGGERPGLRPSGLEVFETVGRGLAPDLA